KILKSVEWSPEIKPGPAGAFEIQKDGVEWELVRIYRPFVYHPRLTIGTSEAILQTPDGTAINDGLPLATFIQRELPDPSKVKPLDPKKPATEQQPQSDEEFNKGPDLEIPLLAFKDGEDTNERIKKEFLLDKMSDIIEGITQKIMWQDLGAAVQASSELMMDAAELIPGIGQGVTAARAAVAGAQFLLTDDFQALLERVRKDPYTFVKKIITKLEDEILDPANLWLFILLGELPYPLQILKNMLPKPTSSVGDQITPEKVSEESTGKLARVLKLIKRLAFRTFGALNYLKGK